MKREGSGEPVEAMSPAAALGGLLAREAHRAASGYSPDAARLAAGWEFRFVADERRAEECVQLYRELGYDVAAEPVLGRQIADECTSCQLVTALRFQAIYTRRRDDSTPAPRAGGPETGGAR